MIFKSNSSGRYPDDAFEGAPCSPLLTGRCYPYGRFLHQIFPQFARSIRIICEFQQFPVCHAPFRQS